MEYKYSSKHIAEGDIVEYIGDDIEKKLYILAEFFNSTDAAYLRNIKKSIKLSDIKAIETLPMSLATSGSECICIEVDYFRDVGDIVKVDDINHFSNVFTSSNSSHSMDRFKLLVKDTSKNEEPGIFTITQSEIEGFVKLDLNRPDGVIPSMSQRLDPNKYTHKTKKENTMKNTHKTKNGKDLCLDNSEPEGMLSDYDGHLKFRLDIYSHYGHHNITNYYATKKEAKAFAKDYLQDPIHLGCKIVISKRIVRMTTEAPVVES